tara:strand:- start:191 stop:1360 length:1170 start_codon:yes stop_codon:yes gene_type:complete
MNLEKCEGDAGAKSTLFDYFDPDDGGREKLSRYLSDQNNELFQQLNEDLVKSALELKKELCRKGLNLVTIESVTSGLIGSTLTDVSGGGSYYYGGFIVYNTDAKRRWVGVKTGNLYNSTTAEQMAQGALSNSGAMVSLSITGNALAYPTDTGCQGVADVGVSIRTNNKNPYTVTERIDSNAHIRQFREWIDISNRGDYPNIQQHKYVNILARKLLAIQAMDFCTETLSNIVNVDDKLEIMGNPLVDINEDTFKFPDLELSSLDGLRNRNYLSLYENCNEPDGNITSYLDKEDVRRSVPLDGVYAKDALCHSDEYPGWRCPINMLGAEEEADEAEDDAVEDVGTDVVAVESDSPVFTEAGLENRDFENLNDQYGRSIDKRPEYQKGRESV